MQQQQTLLNTKKSQELYKKACELIPGGVNSPVRSFKSVGGNPLFISKAKGAYIWDVDDNKYIDYVQSWGALINGHIPNEVISSIEKALAKGISYGASCEAEIELASLIINSFPLSNIHKIRFVNSGTEAVMTAIRLARAYTKRNKIIKYAGCYHGHSDAILASSGSGVATFGITETPGIPKNVLSDVIVLPFNDLSATEITMRKFPSQIAAIIVEPVCGNMGVISPKDGFLTLLRELTQKFNCLLIFDEVITGFRLALGGAQEKYKVSPDLTILGKIIGGGMPIGAVGGKKEIMNLLAPEGPVYQAGTLAGNPVSVACGIANLKLLLNNIDIYQYLDTLTLDLCREMEKINQELGVQLQINRVGSMFTVFFTDSKVVDYKTAKKSDTKKFADFFQNMLSREIYLAPSQFESNFISSAHKETDISKTLEAYKESLEKIFV